MSSLGRKIYQFRRSQGWDQKTLARELGVSQATVSRWEADKQEPDADGYKALARVMRVTVDILVDTSKGSSLGLLEVAVVGDVQAGVARESYEWPDDERYSVAVPPDPRYPGLPRFGLVIKGPSMNVLYPEGTIVICIRAIDLARSALPGEKAIVCKRTDAGLVETTCKEIRLDGTGKAWAWPVLSDPEHQAPLPLVNGGDADDPDVWIDAIVVGSYRFE